MNLCAQFFSDLHIQRETDPRAVLFESTLKSLVGRSTHIFLVGDVFDLWIADRPYFQKRYANIVEALRELQTNGTEIHLFEGNHDIHFGEFWQKEFGASVHQSSLVKELGPWKVRIEHGDLMNLADKSYLRLRWFLRTPLIRYLSHKVSGEFIASFADPWSRHSRKASSPKQKSNKNQSLARKNTQATQSDQRAERIRKMMYKFAHAESAKVPLDFIITGHTHVQDDLSFESKFGHCRFINLGSWFEQPLYFEITENGGTWRTVK